MPCEGVTSYGVLLSRSESGPSDWPHAGDFLQGAGRAAAVGRCQQARAEDEERQGGRDDHSGHCRSAARSRRASWATPWKSYRHSSFSASVARAQGAPGLGWQVYAKRWPGPGGVLVNADRLDGETAKQLLMDTWLALPGLIVVAPSTEET